MSSALPIRPTNHDDLGAIRSLLVGTWHHTYDPLPGREGVTEITDRWHATHVLARQLERTDGPFLIAERGSAAVGHAIGRARDPSTLMVVRLCVRPPDQRRGIGRRLMTALVERHPEARRIRLTVGSADAAIGPGARSRVTPDANGLNLSA